MNTPAPEVIDVKRNGCKGVTAFFRNRPFLQTLLPKLRALKTKPKLFFHACSIGAEPYSFAAAAYMQKSAVHIEASDLDEGFVYASDKALYPHKYLAGMTEAEQACFMNAGDDKFKPIWAVRKMVNFLPPCSVSEPLPHEYDAVFAMNVLTYLTPEGQHEAIQTMARAAKSYLCLTAFHPDTIKADLQAAGFAPVLDNQAEIHNGWGDRIREGGAAPGSPQYSWILPPYNTDVPDYEWRYTSIFERIQL